VRRSCRTYICVHHVRSDIKRFWVVDELGVLVGSWFPISAIADAEPLEVQREDRRSMQDLETLGCVRFRFTAALSASGQRVDPGCLYSLFAMILVIALELVLLAETLQHGRNTLGSFRDVQGQVKEIVECVRRFLASRANNPGADFTSPGLIDPCRVLDLGRSIPDVRRLPGSKMKTLTLDVLPMQCSAKRR
jgi:hypothetical protein